MRDGANVTGVAFLVVFLALISLGGAGLAFLGHDVGIDILALVAGFLAGGSIAYFLTKPRRYRAWAYAGLGMAILSPFAVAIFGLARGIDRLVIDLGLDSVAGSIWFNLAMGAMQIIFGRSSNRELWGEVRNRDGSSNGDTSPIANTGMPVARPSTIAATTPPESRTPPSMTSPYCLPFRGNSPYFSRLSYLRCK